MLKTKILCAPHADSLGFQECEGISAWHSLSGGDFIQHLPLEKKLQAVLQHLLSLHWTFIALKALLAAAPCSNHVGAMF